MNLDLEHLYDTWFTNERFWFNASPEDDLYLKQQFESWLGHDITFNIITKKQCIAAIILYDQIPRNIYRNNPEKVATFSAKACICIGTLAKITNAYAELSANEWCFTMLPLRHTNIIQLIHKVVHNAWGRLLISQNTNDIKTYRRFIKATYERTLLHRYEDNEVYVKSFYPLVQFTEWSSSKYSDILDYVPDNPFNVYHGVHNNIVDRFHDMLRMLKPKKIILSLSGGIDSMVCSIILKRLQIFYKFDIHAIHINYCNRKTCENEETFLKDWCRFLEIPIHIRAIHEIKREVCKEHELRETYETYTRNVRYNTYKYVWEHIIGEGMSCPFVILGHNQDDVCENILTNIAQQTKYEMLTGMDLISFQDGINFVRPMLSITKHQIRQFSRENAIPHLPNSTPAWSMRGKIRDIVRPALLEWHPKILHGMISLSKNVTDMHHIVENYVKIVIRQTSHLKVDEWIWKTTLDTLPTQPIFWRSYIDHLLKVKLSMKSLLFLEERLKKYKAAIDTILNVNVPIAKNITIHLQNDISVRKIYVMIKTKNS
jgi:tRNA(Ile)-lysidine synthetase-like protein